MLNNTSAMTNTQRTFFGHPRGLSTLFFVELWERFSYYGMTAILLYYLYTSVSDGGLGLSQASATAIVSIYSALVYMSGILGGWIADRLLGMRRAIFVGGVFIMCGHIALAIPGGISALLISMALIVLGTGLLKPNVSSSVGQLYARDDLRRDSGFSLFYMGINLGAFIAPYFVGTLGQKVNFHLGFSLAAIGMAIGLAVYLLAGRHLSAEGLRPANPIPRGLMSAFGSRISIFIAGLGVLVLILGPTGLLTVSTLVNTVTICSVVLPIVYLILMLRSRNTSRIERSRLLAYVPLFVGAVCYWVVNEQSSSVLAAFADQRTNSVVFGFHVPSSWFASLNPIATIILAPMFAYLWFRLGARQPSTPTKFVFGLVLGGLSFVIMAGPALLHGTDTPASPIWLVASYFLVICGSMCLSPVGLSATTKLAPAAFQAQMMSLWFLAPAAASGINAQLVQLYSPEMEARYFLGVGLAVIAAGGLMILVGNWSRRRMVGIK
ncbi:proton-dependent oligopeptide transporter, POT family [Brevibacterium siliguriense]|uniref:Proton-dependent oligopeptide transporter, POT family n=1 Tax=Brevibacterium siliguriense TaxID=1136497 RepID=A0A1H1V546_9MICO|nr:peptide MFS transporter [Brevibacterium siliguriense]SDS79815.1 proton-dependent oligopeptide transporter, POT family [Brevibacterium siliguriense]